MKNSEIEYVEKLILTVGELSQQQSGKDDDHVSIADLAKRLGVNTDRLTEECVVLQNRYGLANNSLGPSVTLSKKALPILAELRKRADRQRREREHRLQASLFRLHKYGTEPNGEPFASFANIPLRKEYSDEEIEAAYSTLMKNDWVEKVGTVELGGGTGKKDKYRITGKGKNEPDQPKELPPESDGADATPPTLTFEGW